MLLQHFLMLFNQASFGCKKISHIFWLRGSITPIICNIGPIFNDENESIQIFNAKLRPRPLQINDDTYNTRNSINFKFKSHNTKDLMNQEQNIWKWRYSKIARHDLPTKPKGSQSLLVAQTIVKIIIVHSSNWTWLHHNLMQLVKRTSHCHQLLLVLLMF
jgi:hypothetical protein